MLKKKKQRIPVEECSPPPSESDSGPDSEAISRRRRREGFPFPEAVTLLEKFLKEAEEKVEETNHQYTRPGTALTMVEISSLDRKVLGISAIIKRVGDKMKKLEEDSWKEMEEILEGGKRETGRNKEKLSYLLAILQPSRDASPLLEFLEKEADVNMDGSAVPPSSGGTLANGPVLHEESSRGSAVATQPKDPKTGGNEHKQLGRGLNKKNGDSEVKKEVKEEVEEMDEGAATDKPAEGGKETSKRREKEKLGENGATGGVVKTRKGQVPDVIVKEEIGGVDLCLRNKSKWMRKYTNRLLKWMMEGPSGVPIHAKPKRRRIDISDELEADELDFQQNEVDPYLPNDFSGMNDDLDEMGAAPGESDPNDGNVQRNEDGLGEEEGEQLRRRKSCRLAKPKKFYGDFIDFGGEGQEKRKNCQKEEKGERLPHYQRNASDEAAEEEQEDGEMDETVDHNDSVDDGSDEKSCPVDECTQKFSCAGDRKTHMRKHPKPLLCRVCKHSFKTCFNLRQHYIVHTGERPFKCGVCEKTFNRKRTLDSHQRIHTGERPHKCDSCGYQGSYSSGLKKHIRSHTGEKPYSCTVCNQRFNTSYNLAVHMRSHTGERPYECDTCEFKTTTKHQLKVHQRIHIGEKPYSCTVCDKRFAHLSNVNNHIRIHTGERPYECDMCEYKASQLNHLKKHKRIHTGEKPHSCACGFKSSDPSSLRKHKKRFSH